MFARWPRSTRRSRLLAGGPAALVDVTLEVCDIGADGDGLFVNAGLAGAESFAPPGGGGRRMGEAPIDAFGRGLAADVSPVFFV